MSKTDKMVIVFTLSGFSALEPGSEREPGGGRGVRQGEVECCV